MKKILAVLLTVAMIATMFALSAGAETKVTPVGPNSDDPSSTTGDQKLNVQVTEITHKYAVDVTFGIEDLTIGKITWNTETLTYETENGASLGDKTQTITVSNRSDMPIYAFASVTDTPDDSITVTATKDSATNRLEVLKATAGTSTGSGSATSGTISINIASTAWNQAIDYYVNQKVQNPTETQFTIATITVTITKE